MAVAGILMVAAALRFYRLGAQSLWIDELFTLRSRSASPLAVIDSALRANNSPPLYFLLTSAVTALLGVSEAALRLPSAVAGTLSVALMHRLALRLFGCSRTAWIAALLLAVNPLHVWFSQEARNYTLVLAFALAACIAYLRAVERGQRRDWIALATLLVLSGLTSMQGLLVLPVLLVWTALDPPPRRCRRPLAAVFGVAGLMAGVLAAVLLSHHGPTPPARAFSGAEIGYSFYCFTVGYSFGPSLQELQTLPLRQALSSNWPQLAVGGLLTAAACLAGFGVPRRQAARPLTWVCAGLAFALAIHAFTAHSYHVRYALPAVLGILLLTARSIALAPRHGPVLLLSFCAVSLLSVGQWFGVPKYGKDDTREAIARILQEAPNIRRVLVAPWYMRSPVDYYLTRAGATSQAEALLNLEGFDPELADRALLLTRPQHVPFLAPLEARLRAAMDAQGWQTATTRTYHVFWPATP